MKFIACTLLLIIAAQASTAADVAYLVDGPSGVVRQQVRRASDAASARPGTRFVVAEEVSDAALRPRTIGASAFLVSDFTNVTVNVPLTQQVVTDYLNSVKPALQKKAEKALIKLLKRGGYLAAGATSIPAGVIDQVRSDIMDDELAGSGNGGSKAGKLEQYLRVIEKFGGDPQAAFDHTM